MWPLFWGERLLLCSEHPQPLYPDVAGPCSDSGRYRQMSRGATRQRAAVYSAKLLMNVSQTHTLVLEMIWWHPMAVPRHDPFAFPLGPGVKANYRCSRCVGRQKSPWVEVIRRTSSHRSEWTFWSGCKWPNDRTLPGWDSLLQAN